MYNISVFLQHQFILYAPQVYQYSAKPSFMDKPVARFFNYSCKGLNLADL